MYIVYVSATNIGIYSYNIRYLSKPMRLFICTYAFCFLPHLVGLFFFSVYISYAAGSLLESKLICLPVRARVWVCVRLNIKRHCQDYESNVFRIFFFKWKQRTTRHERNLKSNSVNNRVEIHI